MFRTKLFALLTAGVVAIFSAGCLLSVEPDEAENPVGTEHTVTATLIDPTEVDPEEFCDNLLDELEGVDPEELNEETLFFLELLVDVCEEGEVGLPTGAVGPADHNLVNFIIVSGPNAGLNSDEDGVCEPLSCDIPDENDQVGWTYQSNGVAGTDEIEVCVNPFGDIPEIPDLQFGGGGVSTAQEIPEEFEELAEILTNVLNETLGTDHEFFVEFFCQTVEKTWIENTPTPQPQNTAAPSRPNIGAGLSGLFAGQPTALPTAPAPAAVAPSATIRPPSTGDAGLR